MKNLIFLFFAFLFVTVSAFAENQYKIEDNKVDALFEQSSEVTLDAQSQQKFKNLLENNSAGESFASDDDRQLIAGIVALVSIYIVPVGWIFPVHRFILGTNGQGFKIFALYFCPSVLTAGLFSVIVTTVDGIFILVDDSKKKYLNNSRWIMWM